MPIDPGNVLSGNNRPLSSKQTFINQSAATYKGMAGTMARKTIFGGEYKFFSSGME